MAGGKMLLQHFDFEIRSGQHIALVGVNGAGKTTLLRLINGELALERDDYRQGKGIFSDGVYRTGILKQNPFGYVGGGEEQTLPAYKDTEPADDWDLTGEEYLGFEVPGQEIVQEYDDMDIRIDREKELGRLMQGLALSREDLEKSVRELSGGQQTKLALIKLILDSPDILLLDEPTNHLDVDALMWLEEFIRNYRGAVVMVSHDRYFLDETAQVVYELTSGKLVRYQGNYTQYRNQKRKKDALLRRKYEQQQKEIERLEKLITRFKNRPRKAAFARSRKTILDRMERVPKPERAPDHIFAGEILPDHTGPKWVVEADKLCPGYENLPLFELSMRIRRGQKIGVIGPNGAGKTTLLKTVAGRLSPVSGKCLLNEGVEIGYFDQMVSLEEIGGSDSLSDGSGRDVTVLSFFRKQFPLMEEGEIRKYLAGYLFRGRDTGKELSMLSGGEKARLALAAILGKKPNFLMLDEPTNHMDIPARETLESAFQAYRGTILFISHDRYFTEQVADSLLIINPGSDGGMGSVRYYPFGYRHYMERLKALQKAAGWQKPAAGSDDQQGNENKEEIRNTDRQLSSSMSSLSALVQAEDAALIEGLQKVPEKTPMQARQMSTAEAQYDWEMTLAKRALEEAREKVTRCEQALAEAQIREWAAFGAGEEPGEWTGDNTAELLTAAQAEEELQKAREEYQASSIIWYDLWQETHPDPE